MRSDKSETKVVALRLDGRTLHVEPANDGRSILFSDLGPTGNVYISYTSSAAFGGSAATAFQPNGRSITVGDLFTVSGGGPVSQIDLAVFNLETPNTFYASIWTDNAGIPGIQVPGAYWSLTTTSFTGACCSLVSITGITGVNLNGGQQYTSWCLAPRAYLTPAILAGTITRVA